jgi:outer membrane lipoprotein LolB
MRSWRALAGAGLLLLAGCASTLEVAQLPPAEREAALERQVARERVLAGAEGWSLAGRVALTNHGRGGSGRIDWRQQGDAYEVELSAPITRQGWRLEGGPGGARLEGLEGGARVGADATVLLREATGWEIPVAALASWVRGARDPEGGTATLQFGADGRLARMQQDGWQLAYGEWVASPGLGIDLPTRIEAERGEARVRLVVDGWSADAR